MDHENGWSAGPVGAGDTGRDELVRMVRGAARELPGGQVVTASVVCEACSAGEFESAVYEVWAGECHCWGCLLPIGVQDGDVTRVFGRASAYPWKLAPTEGTPDPAAEPADYFWCPEGHKVFQVAVGLVLDESASVRAMSVGLRCPEDGGLHLFIDNARVTA
ncbi:hypothetical protein [Streptomyces sp. NPDC026092]|uniref:hypothetical protein n=1 Tax=Streptomyces sp. NPDC026092 TaxID=3154797 RepID=UPI00340330A4